MKDNKHMKSKAELLIETLTRDSGRTHFTANETLQLQEISLLEGKNNNNRLIEKIEQFKEEFVLIDEEWLC